jgi:hypothetical protein
LFEKRYLAVISEFEGCFRSYVSKEMPSRQGRVDLMTRLLGTNIAKALCLLQCLHLSISDEGDICEFGIAQGATSALLANEISDTDKNIWLFDSFEGLPRPTGKDLLKDDIFNLGSIEAYRGTMACSVDEVQSRLNEIGFPLTRAKIVPGFIEQTILLEGLPDRVCFAYVDFDFYEPILLALNYLSERLSPNGHIVVDDYDYFSTGAKTAVDEFVQQSSAFELVPPPDFTGQFAIIRRTQVN